MASRLVLVAAAERDPFVSELVRLLQSEGCEVLLVHDTQSARRTARSRQPDLIVLDAVLRGGDGLSLCRRLKSDPTTGEIPVFCFSVLMARDRSVEAGADGFMLKPTEQDLLLSKIREVLHSRVRRLPQRLK